MNDMMKKTIAAVLAVLSALFILDVAAEGAKPASQGGTLTSSVVTAQLIPRDKFDEVYAEVADVEPLAEIRGGIESAMLDPFYEIEYLTGFYTRLCVPSANETVSAVEYIDTELSKRNAGGLNALGIADMDDLPENVIVFVYMPGSNDAEIVCGSAVSERLTEQDLGEIEAAAERSGESVDNHIRDAAKEMILRLFDGEDAEYPRYSYAAEYAMYPNREPDYSVAAVAEQPFYPELDGEERTTLSYVVRKVFEYSGVELIVRGYDESAGTTPDEQAAALVESRSAAALGRSKTGYGGKVVAVIYTQDAQSGAVAGNRSAESLLTDEEKTEILKACSDGYEDEFEAVYGGMAEFVRIVFNGGRYFIPQDQLFTEFIEEVSAGPNYLVIFIACVTGALLSALGVYILFRLNREKVYAFNRTVDAKISYMKRSVREKISEKLVEMKNNIKVRFFKK